jgi:putative glutamine amidotransferase
MKSTSAPTIAIVSTSGEDKTKSYVETIEAHGGIPLVLNPGDSHKPRGFHGLLLTGGGDMQEKYYDHEIDEEERKTLGQREPEREDYEQRLLQETLDAEIPALGICRGCQIMNVFAGGTLIPDIPTWQKRHKIEPVLKHRDDKNLTGRVHDIKLVPGTLFASLFTTEGAEPAAQPSNLLGVNSSHHQALSNVPEFLRVSAHAPDGIIEAIEHPDKPFWLGLQFHPERMWRANPLFSRIFATFMEHARQTGR